jgi:peptidoglycan/xylan/chitin deacetylase (PgdA/CDA1 family)
MSVTDFVARRSLALACRFRRPAPCGVIINWHTLTGRETRFQIDVLSRWFDFIHHDDLLERLVRRRSRPFCLLTFDDGKRSGATEAAPELERLGVPAIFYVVTRFLTDGTLLWFDRRDEILRTLGYTPSELDLEGLKRLPLALVTERLDRAYDQHKVSPDTPSDHVRAMSWDDARDLTRRGFTIGAHGLRHSTLTCETHADALADIEQSIAEVSAQVGTCTTFAFPNGSYSPLLGRHALRCGVRTAMSTDPMWVDSRFPLWRLPRVQLFGHQSRSTIELKLAAGATRLLAGLRETQKVYRRLRTSS